MEIEFLEKLEFLFSPARLKIAYGGRGGGGIYCITNKVNGKIYIGSSFNCLKRWGLHKNRLRNSNHDNKHLQAAWNMYGEDNFEFVILEYVEHNKKQLEAREQYWLDLTKSYDRKLGYNLAVTANSQLGIKRSEETKAKISAFRKGIKVFFTDEHKLNLSKASKGKQKSQDHLNKIKEANILRCRDLTKWPHERGNRCICKECTNKKRIMQIQRRLKNGN